MAAPFHFCQPRPVPVKLSEKISLPLHASAGPDTRDIAIMAVTKSLVAMTCSFISSHDPRKDYPTSPQLHSLQVERPTSVCAVATFAFDKPADQTRGRLAGFRRHV